MERHHSNPHDDQPRDLLDSLLREADWPGPDPQSLARLQKHWRVLSPSRPRTPHLSFRRGMALAAALAGVAAGALLWHMSQPDDEPQLAAPVPFPERELSPVEQAPPVPSGPFTREVETSEGPTTDTPESPRHIDEPVEPTRVATAREPTAYESLLFLAEQRRTSAARQEQIDQWATAAIEKLVANPAADFRTVGTPPGMARPAIEARMLALAQRLQGEERVAAIRLLAIVGTQRSVPILLKWSAHPATRDAAIRSLATLADSALLGKLVAAEQNLALRQELLASLLKRGDATSVAIFLSFVEEDAKTPAALAATADLPPQVLQTLLEFLQGPQLSQRMAAARVLGQIDDPRVAQRLIHMVQDNVCRQEALVALFSSRRREASEFLAFARHDPLLMASVHAAHYQFSNLP